MRRMSVWSRSLFPLTGFENKMKQDNRFLKMGGGVLHIALCFDEALAPYVEPLVYSISKQHPGQEVQIYLVYQELTAGALARLYQMEQVLYNIGLTFLQVPRGILDRISVDDYMLPIETYFRFLLPELLPQLERVLYLDIDILVCGNLQSLYQVDLGDSCIAAVVENDIGHFFPDYPPTIGVEAERYFNAGVLLLDLEKMRQRDLSRILIDIATQMGPHLRFGDQDVLNLYFKDEVVLLPVGYNYTNYMMRYDLKPWEELTILHFNGPVKPWFTEFERDPNYIDFFMNYIAKHKDHHLEYLTLLLRR